MPNNLEQYDVIIIGAGAAGLMCAAQAGYRGKSVLLLDHSKKVAEKIRISGGGRCNFTNIFCEPNRFLSNNEHFCKSVLSRYTQQDFIRLVEKHGIAYHEKKLGQLFCDVSSKEIIDMFLKEINDAGVTFKHGIEITNIDYNSNLYQVSLKDNTYNAKNLVIATGGLSIPKIGATNFGYKVAEKFGLNVIKTRAGLVPLTFSADLLDLCKSLSGISVDAVITYKNTEFREGLLFTHRGLSGPSILQISSYWEEGKPITINLSPDIDALDFFKEKRDQNPKQDISTILSLILPSRLANAICEHTDIKGKMAELGNKDLEKVATMINAWEIKPSGTEGYRTAEVTLGGVNTDELSSKTLESKKQKGLYFIGEVIDVTGHLGGFNFQWAWSSGYIVGNTID